VGKGKVVCGENCLREENACAMVECLHVGMYVWWNMNMVVCVHGEMCTYWKVCIMEMCIVESVHGVEGLRGGLCA
jgi:hypothetical protein